MRFQPILSAVLLGASGAAIAQVAGAPIEAKQGNGATAGNDLSPATGNGSERAPDNTTAPGNVVDQAK